jgi:hypothetical protein
MAAAVLAMGCIGDEAVAAAHGKLGIRTRTELAVGA